jgi:hypothetical protein
MQRVRFKRRKRALGKRCWDRWRRPTRRFGHDTRRNPCSAGIHFHRRERSRRAGGAGAAGKGRAGGDPGTRFGAALGTRRAADAGPLASDPARHPGGAAAVGASRFRHDDCGAGPRHAQGGRSSAVRSRSATSAPTAPAGSPGTGERSRSGWVGAGGVGAAASAWWPQSTPAHGELAPLPEASGDLGRRTVLKLVRIFPRHPGRVWTPGRADGARCSSPSHGAIFRTAEERWL